MLPHQRHQSPEGNPLSHTATSITSATNGEQMVSLRLCSWKTGQTPSGAPCGDGGAQCEMCNARQGAGPGTVLALQHPDGWLWLSPLSTLPLLSHFNPGLVFLRIQLQSSERRDAEGVLLRQSWYWNKPLRLSSAQTPSPNVWVRALVVRQEVSPGLNLVYV